MTRRRGKSNNPIKQGRGKRSWINKERVLVDPNQILRMIQVGINIRIKREGGKEREKVKGTVDTVRRSGWFRVSIITSKGVKAVVPTTLCTGTSYEEE